MVDKNDKTNVDKLHEDIEELKEKVREIGEDTTEEGMRRLDRLHQQLHVKAGELMEAYAPLLEKYRESGKAAVRNVEAKVAEKPLSALLLAFGAGVIIGTLCRCHHHKHGS